MNILIVYTPRSKSTFACKVLAKKYGLTEVVDTLTLSRIANQNFSEYNILIDKINTEENICVKINGNDFIDLTRKEISEYYKQINYNKFDKIVFLTRVNFVDAILSYAYMNPADQSSWHRKKGQTIDQRAYTLLKNKVYYLSRGYVVFKILTDYIKNVCKTNIYNYEYESLEHGLSTDFAVNDFDTELEPNNINYFALLENKEVLPMITEWKDAVNKNFWIEE
jgi:hypothetical protein